MSLEGRGAPGEWSAQRRETGSSAVNARGRTKTQLGEQEQQQPAEEEAEARVCSQREPQEMKPELKRAKGKLVASLHSAASEGKVELVRLLLRCGADVNAQDEQVSLFCWGASKLSASVSWPHRRSRRRSRRRRRRLRSSCRASSRRAWGRPWAWRILLRRRRHSRRRSRPCRRPS